MSGLLPASATRLILALLLTGIALTAAGAPVYVFPPEDPVRRADAIVVLGGHDDRRYSFGLHLAELGYAPNLVMSNPDGDQDAWLTNLCTSERFAFTVSCFDPDPSTTEGEALAVGALAVDHGWRSIIVVTMKAHVARARYIVGKCFPGDLIMVASPARMSPGYWVYTYGYQTFGYVKNAPRDPC